MEETSPFRRDVLTFRVIGSTMGASPACSPGCRDLCTPGAASHTRRCHGGERGPKNPRPGAGWLQSRRQQPQQRSAEAQSVLQSAPVSGAAAPHLLRQPGSGIKASRACLEALQST